MYETAFTRTKARPPRISPACPHQMPLDAAQHPGAGPPPAHAAAAHLLAQVSRGGADSTQPSQTQSPAAVADANHPPLTSCRSIHRPPSRTPAVRDGSSRTLTSCPCPTTTPSGTRAAAAPTGPPAPRSWTSAQRSPRRARRPVTRAAAVRARTRSGPGAENAPPRAPRTPPTEDAPPTGGAPPAAIPPTSTLLIGGTPPTRAPGPALTADAPVAEDAPPTGTPPTAAPPTGSP